MHQDRPIEPVLGADPLDRLRGGLGAEEGTHRIARQGVDQHEGHEADAEQHRQQLNRPVEDELEALHGATVRGANDSVKASAHRPAGQRSTMRSRHAVRSGRNRAQTPATLQRLARLAGLELERDRAERLLADFVALIEADRRLAALDLGDCAATGDPWGRSSADA